MAEMRYFNPDDLLDIADGTNVKLVSSSGGVRKEFVEEPNVSGGFYAAATKAVKLRGEYQLEYKVMAETLVLDLGELLTGIDSRKFLITALSVSCQPLDRPRVSLTVREFLDKDGVASAGAQAQLNTADSKTATITIAGGFGIVNLFGATAAGAISSQMSVQMQTGETYHPTDGVLQEGGFVVYGLKQEVTVESTGAVTLPVGAVAATPADQAKSDTGAQTHRASWFTYL
jgi:hypothetical protein